MAEPPGVYGCPTPTAAEAMELEAVLAEADGLPARKRTRDLLTRFVKRMAGELRVNAWKGNWREEIGGERDASFEVIYHAAKLDWALTTGNREAVREFAADVANCAMIASDMIGVWDDPEPGSADDVDPTTATELREDRYGNVSGGTVLEEDHAQRLKGQVVFAMQMFRGERETERRMARRAERRSRGVR